MDLSSVDRGGNAIAEIVKGLYCEGQSDYGMDPIVRVDAQSQPIGRIKDGDAVIFCCRRGEREIELTEAFTEADFSYFPRQNLPNLEFAILTLYHEKFVHLPVAFAPVNISDTLGEIVSRAGLRQLRCAESEKFAHITFFLNGGRSEPFLGETDIRIPSPKGIPFDQVPELSLPLVSDEVIHGIEQGYDLIVTNFANGDVIGHTTNRESKIQCAECIDSNLGRVVEAALTAEYVVLVTADHGNLEELFSSNGSPHVAHTTNPVEMILLDPLAAASANLHDGKLADIAPTILSALGCEQSPAMDGHSLASDDIWGGRRKVLLIILDGWGNGKADDSNPIFLGHTPVWDDLLQHYPTCHLHASGDAVGLQKGKPGNSEAGHTNIGAGRIVFQDDVRLDRAILDGSFYNNQVFLRLMNNVIDRQSSLHLLALLTEKSSHGSIDYPLALLKIAKVCGVKEVYVHVIFDGRSTEPGSAPALLKKFETRMAEIGLGQIVSGIGRGIALDRDGNYARIKRAYDCLVLGVGHSTAARDCTAARQV
jgi:2,3-bisphosphoglycerate-independent phosphoglycerate mutase